MQPHQISGIPLSSNRSQKSRPQKIEGIVSFLLKKPQGSWHCSCVNNLCSPRSCKPLRDKFPALMSRVRLALKEHKVNLQLWSSTLLIPCFEGISGLLVLLWIGTHKQQKTLLVYIYQSRQQRKQTFVKKIVTISFILFDVTGGCFLQCTWAH